MARGGRLTGCPDCGRAVSVSAVVCPGCGRRLRRAQRAARWTVVAGFALFAAGLWYIDPRGGNAFGWGDAMLSVGLVLTLVGWAWERLA